VSQECLEKLEDKDHLVQWECLELKELMDQEVLLETEVYLDHKECLD